MYSMEPVLKRGFTDWDQASFPKDEFEDRVRLLQGSMDEQGFDALLVINYCVLGNLFDYADFAFIAGLQTGGALLIPPEGEPLLMTFGGGRELYFLKSQTWLTDIVAAGKGLFKQMQERLAGAGYEKGVIGVVGEDTLPPDQREAFASAFAGYEIKPFDAAMTQLRIPKRPREVMAVSSALSIARSAVQAGEKVHASGGGNLDAMLAAEACARSTKARDVRVLANTGGGDLRPFENSPNTHHDQLLLWVAVQYQGYWAEACLTSPEASSSPASQALKAMKHEVRPGARIADIAEAGLSQLSADEIRSALAYGLGNLIGLSLNEGAEIVTGCSETLPEGALLSLRILALGGAQAGSFAGDIVLVADGGAESLACDAGAQNTGFLS